MTRKQLDGLRLLLLGSVMFLLFGFVLEHVAPARLVDFRMMYYPARCLIQGSDPYMGSDVLRVYQTAGEDRSSDTETVRQVVTRYVYLPTAFCFTVPFALLPWGPAHVLWIALTAGSLIFASFLIWNLGADYAPIASGVLAGFILANSEVLVITGTVAGIAVSLCIVAVWCFLRDRFVAAGILCLAISLAIKPQDACLVWLYFLLAGGANHKRAVQALLTNVVLSLPTLVWIWHIAPNWLQELHSNMAAFFIRGGINDPGPSSAGGHGLAMVISLQPAISVFWDDPHIYNLVSYLIGGPLILLWIVVTLRSRFSKERAWLALAAIAALSMLPIYHRLYDAKLLLLTVPACAKLWSEGSLLGRLALAVNTAAFVATGDLPWAVLLGILRALHLSMAGTSGQILTASLLIPVPFTLLVTSAFYLWVYASHSSTAGGRLQKGSPTAAQIVSEPLDSAANIKSPFIRMYSSLLNIRDPKKA